MHVLTSIECDAVAGASPLSALADFITLEHYHYSPEQKAVIQGIRMAGLTAATMAGSAALVVYGGVNALMLASVAVGIPTLVGYSTYQYFKPSGIVAHHYH